MKNSTQLLPGFHLPTLRRTPRSEKKKLADKIQKLKDRSLSQLNECFGQLIPKHHLQPKQSGEQSRRRIFCKENTFWAFFSQVLDADKGCQEAVRKAQAFVCSKSDLLPSSSTAAYCKARKRLDISSLKSIFQHTVKHLQSMVKTPCFNDRRVIVVDGTGLSMPDTPENQKSWPQLTALKEGCAFPQMRLCGCFCLQTGALLSYKIGDKKSSELPMLRKQWSTFKSGDIFLGDKLYCSYFDLFSFQSMGVDAVVTLGRRKPASDTEMTKIGKATTKKVLGEGDVLIEWSKPKHVKGNSYSREEWEKMSDKLVLRQIRVTIDKPGFRVKSFHIITTLLDADKYPAHEIANLYYRRWEVELFFKDIKITMGMDILRCKSPDMIRKEILMHIISYNCIRYLMWKSTIEHNKEVRRISVKGCIQALRQWESRFSEKHVSQEEYQRLLVLLYKAIADYIVPDRPGRREPRAVKRRRKNFQLLTSPRHEMREAPHRGAKCAKRA
jgi:hypothetical protein